MSVFGSLWRSSSSAQLSQAPKQRAALALASFWNVPSLKQTEHLASISCSCKRQRNIFFSGNYFHGKDWSALGGLLTRHLQSKCWLGGQRIQNIWSNKPGFFSGTSGSLSVGTSGSSTSPWDGSKVPKIREKLEKEHQISVQSRMRPTWVMASSSANTASSSSGDKDPASISSICCRQTRV